MQSRQSIYHGSRSFGIITMIAIIAGLSAFLLTACAGTPAGGGAETVRERQEQNGAGEGGDASTELSLDPELRHGRLENGLAYYIRPNSKPEQRVHMRLVVDAGSVQEREGQRGLAHFVEHMAFNGTETYEKHAIIDYLERTGMRFGPDVNAYTSFDETVYTLDLPTKRAETVEKGVDILKEWAFRIAFSPEEVEKEKGVIVEEWRLGRGARSRMRDEYWPVLMRGSRYAERLPIGVMEVVRRSGAEELRRFYDTWYRPDNMAVIVVGDIDPAKIEDMLRNYFGPVPAAKGELPERAAEGPETEERRVVTATDPEAQNTSVRMLEFHDAFTLRSRDDYRTLLARRLYQNMIGNRLREKTEQRNPPFVDGYFGFGSFIRPQEASVWGAIAQQGEVEKALKTLVREALRVEQHGFHASELKRAKEDLRSSMERAYREREKTPSRRLASEYMRNYLTGEASPGIAREWDLTQELLPEIAMEDIAAIHDRFKVESGAGTVLVTGPDGEGNDYPEESSLQALIDELQGSEIPPYEDADVGEELLRDEPDPGRITARSREEAGEYHAFSLQNGARVYYKQTDFKNAEILFSASSPGGASLHATEDYYAARLAPSFAAASGLGRYSPSELRKLMSGTQVELRPYVSELYEGFRGSTRPQDLELLFQQLHLYFTALREDEALFESYRQRLANVLQNRRNRPEVRLGDLVSSMLYDDHPRRAPLTAEKVEALEASQVYRIFRERFSGAGDFEFFFTGNVSPERLEVLAARYIGSLPQGASEQWRDRGIRYTDRPERRRIRAGMASKSSVRLLYSGEYRWSLAENSLLASMQQLLEIRLREEVREKAGGTYGVSVRAVPSRYPAQEYLVRIGFSCAPDRVEELSGIIEDELERLAREGVSEENVEKVRSIRTSSLEEDRKTNGFWLDFLEGRARYDMDPAELLAKEERIEAVGSDELEQAVQGYLLEGTRLEAVLMPEESDGNGDAGGSEGGE